MLGAGAGIAIGMIARAVETSQLAFGPFAFSGNGALIVPALGTGLALYAVWTWALRRARSQLDLLWSAVGLHLGLGTGLFVTGGTSLAGLAFTGLLFVLPTAGVSYGVYRALGRPGSGTAAVRTGFVGVGLALALPLPMLAVGLMVGPFLATGARAPRQAPLLLGGLLALVLLAGGIAVPLLFIR